MAKEKQSDTGKIKTILQTEGRKVNGGQSGNKTSENAKIAQEEAARILRKEK